MFSYLSSIKRCEALKKCCEALEVLKVFEKNTIQGRWAHSTLKRGGGAPLPTLLTLARVGGPAGAPNTLTP